MCAALVLAATFVPVRPAAAKCLAQWVNAQATYETPLRAAQAGDAKRAARVRAAVRTALAGLDSPRSARAAGYDVDRPVRVAGFDEVDRLDPPPEATFDLRHPAALLYAPGSRGPAGARYTAAAQRDGSALDALVPLSVARWRANAWLCSLPGPLDWSLDIFPRDARTWRLPP
jgi:hypothetical protein